MCTYPSRQPFSLEALETPQVECILNAQAPFGNVCDSLAAGVMIGNNCGGVRVTIIMKNDGSSGDMLYGERTWYERVKVEFGDIGR